MLSDVFKHIGTNLGIDTDAWSATAVISPNNPNSVVAHRGCEDLVPIKV